MKPPRFLLINHKGCRHCQDAEMVMDPNGPLIGYAWFEQLEAENARLKAEVERLRKAGDAMASSIQFNEEMAKDYAGPTIVHQCVNRWNAAKEGKPHA